MREKTTERRFDETGDAAANYSERCLSSAPLVSGWPSSTGADGQPGPVEPVGDGLWADAVPGRDDSERESGCVQLGRFVEGVVVPGALFVVARYLVTIKVSGDGGAMDADVSGQLADGGAGAVGGDQVVDVAGGEASLGGV